MKITALLFTVTATITEVILILPPLPLPCHPLGYDKIHTRTYTQAYKH